ncbi:MAG: hypothetical protein MUE46_02540 [Xanthomonadales bacterium]|jgi:hypothetical protein|nr:hypothetical protein [Xanthomonadales bacterium]
MSTPEALPARLLRYLEQLQISPAKAAALCFDADWRLRRRCGACTQLQLDALDDALLGDLFRAIWTGYSRTRGEQLPMMTLPNGAVVDVHQLALGDQVAFLLVDRRVELAERQLLQQAEQEARLEAQTQRRRQRETRAELSRLQSALQAAERRNTALLAWLEWSTRLLAPSEQVWAAPVLRRAAGQEAGVPRYRSFAEVCEDFRLELARQRTPRRQNVRLSVEGHPAQTVACDPASLRHLYALALAQSLERNAHGDIDLHVALNLPLLQLRISDELPLLARERLCLWEGLSPEPGEDGRSERLLALLGLELKRLQARATWRAVGARGELTISLACVENDPNQITQSLKNASLRGRSLWLALADPKADPVLSAQLDASGASWTALAPQPALIDAALRDAPDCVVIDSRQATLAFELRSRGFRGLLVSLGPILPNGVVAGALDGHCDASELCAWLTRNLQRPS